jgi:hypothetical protein
MAHKITINEYDTECADGCCVDYGTEVSINGVMVNERSQDLPTILNTILSHFGIKAEIKETYNGKSYE